MSAFLIGIIVFLSITFLVGGALIFRWMLKTGEEVIETVEDGVEVVTDGTSDATSTITNEVSATTGTITPTGSTRTSTTTGTTRTSTTTGSTGTTTITQESGDTCVPKTENVIDKGVYTYNSVGECFASSCEDGFVLNDNTCIFLSENPGSEFFGGGDNPNLNQSNSFVVFINTLSNYDKSVRKLSTNRQNKTNIKYSEIYGDNAIFIFQDNDGQSISKVIPKEPNDLGLQNVKNMRNLLTGTGQVNISSFILEEVDAQSDVYRLKTPNTDSKVTLSDKQEIDTYKESSKALGNLYVKLDFENGKYVLTNSQDEADLFKLFMNGRSEEMKLHGINAKDSKLTTKNYIRRITT